ncbi:hypothetical protein RBB78_25110 (plasmid) [Tunturiibacter empetritectus]
MSAYVRRRSVAISAQSTQFAEASELSNLCTIASGCAAANLTTVIQFAG